MQDVLKIMDDEHTRIEQLYQTFVHSLEQQREHSPRHFQQFKQILKKHFKWEKNILFPLFEKRAGFQATDITFVLKNEHEQIMKMYIDRIDILLKERQFTEISKMIIGLEEMLLMHRQMETEIFYPWFDHKLTQSEHEDLIYKLRQRHINRK